MFYFSIFQLNEQLDLRPSQVQQLYHYSLATSLRPKIAAEKACGSQKLLTSSASSSAVSSISKSKKGIKNKFVVILSRKRL